MNNLYVISKDNPFHVVDDVEPNIYGHDLITGFDGPQSQDLDNLDQKKRGEHRYHQRFQLKEDAFALIRSTFAGPLKIQGKSMGCIACAVFNAKPVKLGKIDNISMGGLMFQHVDSKIQLSKALVLDILLAYCGFYLANVPYKIITDVAMPEDVPDDSIDMRQVRLQFQSLSDYQQTRLKDFILNHGTRMGEIGAKD